MKKLEVKQIELAKKFKTTTNATGELEISRNETGEPLVEEYSTYVDLVTACLDELPGAAKGEIRPLSTTELRKRNKILDKFEDRKAGDIVELDDDQAALLYKLVEEKSWALPPSKSKGIMQFIDDVERMQK